MRKIIFFAVLTLVAAAAALGGILYWKNLRITKSPSALPSSIETPSVAYNTTGLPLKLPAGFSISIFAKDLPGARVMAFDKLGNLWVSQTSEGKITQLEIKNGSVIKQTTAFTNLKRPHGLAFDPGDPTTLYIGEEDKISKVHLTTYSKVADLAGGGRHFTRTIGFGPDGRLYVSIGSSCDVCIENDTRRAAIFSMNKDGSDMHKFADGLRNAVFFAWHPLTKWLWTTEMGRDLLGDDLPPDEINIVKDGADYGWPICYGKNIHDTNFDKNIYVRDPCADKTPSYIDIPAHSAPLGLAFIPADSKWPREYWNDLLVAFHGSWNRTVPTGYKVVRYELDENGNSPAGGEGVEDFITGWLTKDGALGRPVDIVALPNGTAYVSDDKAGVIYKIKAPQ